MSAKGQCKEQCAPVPVCQDQAPKCCPDPCAPAPVCQDPCVQQDPCCKQQGLSGKGYAGQGGLGGGLGGFGAGFGYGGKK